MKKILQLVTVIVAFVGIAMVATAKDVYEDPIVLTKYYDSLRSGTYLRDVREIPIRPVLNPIHDYIDLTEEEKDLLCQITMAEAEGEDTEGKALVMRVVLNRCEKHSMSVRAVIYKPNQFAVGKLPKEKNEDVLEALNMVLNGWDESDGALFFNAKGYSKYGDPLFQHGGHYFSK